MNALLLALLAGSYLDNFVARFGAVIVALVAAFAGLELAGNRIPARWRDLSRLVVVMLVIFILVAIPTLFEIMARRNTAPSEHIHDGAIQTEEAVKLLLSGHDPYGADYSNTPMYDWYWGDDDTNPALKHNAYLPLTFLVTVPFFQAAQAWLGWFDVRFVLLLAFAALLLLVPQLIDDWDRKLGLVIVIGLNPLFVPFFVNGRNDVLVLCGVIAAILLLQRGHISAAAVALGLAAGFKQTAWLLVPFFLAYLYWGPYKRDVKAVIVRAGVPIALLLGVVMVPFLLWNAQAFVEDTLLFVSVTFPIAGYGLPQLALLTGAVASKHDPFPSLVLEILIALPLLVLLWRYQRSNPSIRAFVGAGALFTFVFAFLNRVFQDNYAGYIISLAATAYFLPEPVTYG